LNALEITCLDKADGPLTAEQHRNRRGLAVLMLAGHRRSTWDKLSDEARERLRVAGDEIQSQLKVEF
jgi:hypothetical protein